MCSKSIKNYYIIGKQFSKRIPWFPMDISDIETFYDKTLVSGVDLSSDHPGFNDSEYLKRRKYIANNVTKNEFVNYNSNELSTWKMVYKKLKELHHTHTCKEFNHAFQLLEKECGYSENNIPQLKDVSNFLLNQTGFSIKPVSGLLSSRYFLNALAFKTFFSTQYIRHHSVPLYTPEPDICHELLGHVPMLANPEFASFSHEIGLASLGATDEEIKRLATCYWFTVEFGLCNENDTVKAYGAGLLSSFGELQYACGNDTLKPTHTTFDPFIVCNMEYPITTYQPTYFVVDSLTHAIERLKTYCETEIQRPFRVSYDENTKSIFIKIK
jgi:phenylalanine-4-hydroxylase